MRLLNRLSLRTKLFFIPVLPLAITLCFIILAINDSWKQHKAMAQIQHHVDITSAATTLIHEIQRERGLSAAVVGSEKTLMFEKMLSQRLTVDQQLWEFKEKLQHYKNHELGEKYRLQLSKVMQVLEDFSIRYQVDELRADLAQVINAYSQMNAQLLELVSRAAVDSESLTIANKKSAYFYLLQAKERAGIERAVLSHIFVQDKVVSEKLRKQFYVLLSEQETYLEMFKEHTNPSGRELFDTVFQSPIIEQVNDLRTQIEERDTGFSVDVEWWFNLASERINLITQLENTLQQQLHQSVLEHSRNAKARLNLLILLSIIGIFASLSVSLIVLKAINSQLDSLAIAIAGIEDTGDVNVRARELSNDELGHLARSFNKMMQNLEAAEIKVNMLSQAVEQSPVSVMVMDVSGNIDYVNEAYQQTTGFTREEVIGKNPKIIQADHPHWKVISELWQSVKNHAPWEGEVENRHKNETLFWERVNISPVMDKQGHHHHYLFVSTDITEAKRQQVQIIRQAHFDDLTQLPNRFLALNRLKKSLQEAKHNKQPIAVMFVDLDGFKTINDCLGHEVGDKILMQTAERLNNIVQNSDTVGRLGGDEFLILLTDIDCAERAQQIAEEIMDAFKSPFKHEKRQIVVTTSIGIAIYPDNGDEASQLLRHADMAMYESKKVGRNTYHFFSDSMNKSVVRHTQLEKELHGALSRKEFSLRYQPVIDIKKDRIVAAEVSLHWDNSVFGRVSPDEFIPIAEQSDLIIQLGNYVLKEAMTSIAHWRGQFDNHLHITINVSQRQLWDMSFITHINDQLQHLALPGDCLELEITEDIFTHNAFDPKQQLERCHELGVNIAMNDFGMGFSPLYHLRNYPFKLLKVNRSFIHDFSKNSLDRELLSVILSIGHSLGLKVSAKGVETKQQLLFLKELGFDMAQGFLFSNPMKADDFEQLLKQRSNVN